MDCPRCGTDCQMSLSITKLFPCHDIQHPMGRTSRPPPSSSLLSSSAAARRLDGVGAIEGGGRSRLALANRRSASASACMHNPVLDCLTAVEDNAMVSERRACRGEHLTQMLSTEELAHKISQDCQTFLNTSKNMFKRGHSLPLHHSGKTLMRVDAR